MTGKNSGYRVFDFTLEELKMLHLKDKLGKKTQENHQIVSFAEIVSIVHNLNAKNPRKINKYNKVGLYVEIKNYGWYKEEYAIDMAEIVFRELQTQNLETTAKAAKDIPIII